MATAFGIKLPTLTPPSRKEKVLIAVLCVGALAWYLYDKYEDTLDLTCTNEAKVSFPLWVNFTTKKIKVGTAQPCGASISNTEVWWVCTRDSNNNWVRITLNRSTGYLTASVPMTPYLCEKYSKKF